VLAQPGARAAAAVIESLGRIGSIRAVEPLAALAERGSLQSEARDAMRRIQARLGDVEAGRVSLVEDRGPEGALSLADPAPLPERVKE